MKKTSNYYGTYMRVLQEMPEKPTAIIETICGYCKECYKNPTNTMDRYVGIVMNEECQQLFVAHMRVLQEMLKKPAAIMGFICGYCIFEISL
jgi:hypothetical protein